MITRISAAEAISANGTAVERSVDTIDRENGRRELAATAPVTSVMFRTYFALAQIATRARTAAEPLPCTTAVRAPAVPAESAKAPALKAIRAGGRCSIICASVGAANATITPASQPNRTIAPTANTNPSETPPVSSPSSGTGNRAESIDAAKKAPIPASSAPLWAWVPRDTAAATAMANPIAQTGTTTAKSRDGIRLTYGLPEKVVRREEESER